MNSRPSASDRFNFGEARDVAPALERGREPNLHEAQGEFLRHHALAEREDVGVVVLAVEARRFLVPAQAAAHAANFVGHDGFAVAGAASTMPRSHSPRATASAAGRIKSG